MTTNGIHHVAYRCNAAKETVDFYKAALDMELVLAIAEEGSLDGGLTRTCMSFLMQVVTMFLRF